MQTKLPFLLFLFRRVLIAPSQLSHPLRLHHFLLRPHQAPLTHSVTATATTNRRLLQVTSAATTITTTPTIRSFADKSDGRERQIDERIVFGRWSSRRHPDLIPPLKLLMSPSWAKRLRR
ncbi:hypothetical protein PIB30_003310 [Stylosanthes scabra]|uniref:Secreted protein n=1 Tax=Stylosanthes scabra TaxID=79078 RepID=A0ABU6S385_9FABA|nr:hypothetical protein [Stylosanthes scabra]